MSFVFYSYLIQRVGDGGSLREKNCSFDHESKIYFFRIDAEAVNEKGRSPFHVLAKFTDSNTR